MVGISITSDNNFLNSLENIKQRSRQGKNICKKKKGSVTKNNSKKIIRQTLV